jgi:hypothetical protein
MTYTTVPNSKKIDIDAQINALLAFQENNLK